MEYRKSGYAKLLGAAALVALGGCAAQPEGLDQVRVCPVPVDCDQDNCGIQITVPRGNAPPKVGTSNQIQESLRLRADRRAGIDFTITHEPGSPPGQVYIIFEQSPFLVRNSATNEYEDLWVIHLPSARRLDVVTKPAEACPAPCGCKYTVVNVGRATQEPLDPWIILY